MKDSQLASRIELLAGISSLIALLLTIYVLFAQFALSMTSLDIWQVVTWFTLVLIVSLLFLFVNSRFLRTRIKVSRTATYRSGVFYCVLDGLLLLLWIAVEVVFSIVFAGVFAGNASFAIVFWVLQAIVATIVLFVFLRYLYLDVQIMRLAHLQPSVKTYFDHSKSGSERQANLAYTNSPHNTGL